MNFKDRTKLRCKIVHNTVYSTFIDKKPLGPIDHLVLRQPIFFKSYCKEEDNLVYVAPWTDEEVQSWKIASRFATSLRSKRCKSSSLAVFHLSCSNLLCIDYNSFRIAYCSNHFMCWQLSRTLAVGLPSFHWPFFFTPVVRN